MAKKKYVNTEFFETYDIIIGFCYEKLVSPEPYDTDVLTILIGYKSQ